MAASVGNAAWLQWVASLMGGSRQTYAATFPPDRFYCLLDELPAHLVPQMARQSPQEDQLSTLVLNPKCRLHPGTDLPEELRARHDLVSGFALQGTIAWVQGNANRMLLPFWIGRDVESLVRGLSPNEPVPASIPLKLRKTLAAAGIFIPEARTDSDLSRSQELKHKASAQFRERGYAPLIGLIHPFHVAALRRYYRYRIRTGALQLGDGQSSRRYVDYNEPVARYFHDQIASTLSELAGELLKPSYVYLASYLSGAELKKHTDREQCDFSVTLCLDYSPEPVLATPWPIHLETTAGTVTVYQSLGDGLAYRGTRLPHYRDVLSAGQSSTSIFFHYVKNDFAGPLR